MIQKYLTIIKSIIIVMIVLYAFFSYYQFKKIKKENEILKTSLNSIKNEVRRKEKVIKQINKYNKKLQKLNSKLEDEINNLKTIIPKGKARLSYEEQEKVIKYLNNNVFVNDN